MLGVIFKSHLFLKPSSDPNLEKSYRPVGGISCLMRTFERFLLTKLETFAPITDDSQFAFRKNLSTMTAVTYVLENVVNILDDGHTARFLMLDYSSAFNTISRCSILKNS